MAKNKKSQPKQLHKHHYVRTLISSLFGFIALALIIVSIVVLWLSHTLTNTDQYVKTVSPLVSDKVVQDFVVDKTTSIFMDNQDMSIRDVSKQLLGAKQVAGKTDDQLRQEVSEKIAVNLRSVVSSKEFATLWVENNRAIHEQLITQLGSDSNTIQLNFNPLIKGLVKLSGTTDLKIVQEKLEIDDKVGQVSVEGKQLNDVRRVYDYFQKATLAIVACAVMACLLSILISVHHLRTMRRIGVATGIFALLIASTLSAGSLIKTEKPDTEVVVAIINAVTRDLRLAMIVIAIICLGGAIGSKVYSKLSAKGKLATK